MKEIKTSWVETLHESIYRTEIKPRKNYPVKDGEVVLGVCSDFCKSLYNLARTYFEIGDRTMIDAKYSTEDRKELSGKANEFFKKADLLIELFWLAVRDEFGVSSKENVGLRNDYTIVRLKENSILDIFRNLTKEDT